MSTVTFTYCALDKAGKESRGTVVAQTEDQAYRQVVESGLTPLSIQQAKRKRHKGGGRVRLKDISQFTYQLQVLLEARIPVGEGLAGLAEQEENEAFRRVLFDVAAQVEAGNTISGSMQPFRKVFGDVYVETISAAEKSGTMLQTLEHLSEAIERMAATKRQVVGAMIYPLCVIVTLFFAVGFLVTFTIPNFADMFATLGVELPLLTRVLAAIGNSVQSYWWAYIIGASALGWGGHRMVTQQGVIVERVFDRIPAVNAVLLGLSMARFSRVFSVSLSAGLGLLDALEMGNRAASKHLLSIDIDRLSAQVRAGRRLSEGLINTEYIPSFARRMFTAGEQSGELVRMSKIVAKHYERETEHKVKALTTVIEPVLVVMIATVVLVVALAIFLPMWNMVQLMS